MKQRVRVYVSMRTGECALGVLDSLLFWVASPMPINLDKL